MIKLTQVEKSYGVVRVLKRLNLAVGRGEFVAVMGSSGSGKSTLLNIIGGMDIPERGRVEVEGNDITKYTDDELTLYRRRQTGFIFQFFNLLPNITVSENIAMPLLLDGKEDAAAVSDLIELTGLAGKEDKYPYQLSGGEQQRVAIARALVHDPALILADEPTGSLDSETGRTIMDLIVRLAAERVKTVVLVTHELHIAAYADRIIRISDGIIIQ